MKITALMTHNPQDFFEGAEPEDLRVRFDFSMEGSQDVFPIILGLVRSGYKAILIPGGDDQDG